MKTKAINIDCIEYMRRMPDNYFDLGHCDPPYGIGEDTKANKSRTGTIKQKNGTINIIPGTDFGDEAWDNNPPSQDYFDELFRVSRYVILWGVNYYHFDQKGTSSGRIVWDKCRRTDRAQSDGEVAWTNLFSSVRIVTYMWAGMMQGRSAKNGHIQQGNKKLNEKRLQNGHKPVKLYQSIINRWYNPDWKVFDSHLGSGSHRIACEEEGINFIGTEISTKRYNQSIKWYKERITPRLF